ncbi:hypothetical protein NEMBOFW57_004498 [Staphylotrichum longicolle]|uniref:Major facilitator superfamily transporter n=1 Tax=Staphylotrichum longicolle TaxID=669026 RepID=A0AAD4F9M5_9PEZI|nr:hypothetical protein NEMBOFW57_004498 [Staphylotrichum longicolle]
MAPFTTSLGTSVLASRPSTSHGTTTSSTPDLATLTVTADEKHPTPPSTPPLTTQKTPPEPEEEPPFSTFTPLQKNLIALAASLAALFSTLSSFIYYPALTRISADLGVSLMLVQLTITSYLVIAGVAPAFMGDMADRGGRRPVYVLMFGLMVGANVGDRGVREWAGLLVLRMVQSAGSSVIGGGLTQGFGWRAIFWFLVIFTGSHFVVMVLFFPETQRKIVGNGSIQPKGLIYQTVLSLIRRKAEQTESKDAATEGKQEGEIPKRRRLKFPNPLACLPVLANKGSLLVILITAINYAVKAALQTSLDAQCVELYGLNYLQAGLVYLPSGVGGGFGSYFAGKFVDWNYRRTVTRLAKTQGSQYDKNSPEFPLEKTRLRGVYLLSATTVLGIIGYGLTLKFRWHIAVMLIMQLLTGTATAATFTVFLLPDHQR